MGGTGWGVVYKLDTTGHETVLYAFTGGTDGGQPQAGVTLDPTGNLYGTSYFGGTLGYGVVYKVDTSGHETVLHSFEAGTDGLSPRAGLIRDSAGNLYGTTQYGGMKGWGIVYKVDTTGHETVLHTFMDGTDGAVPYAGVIRDSAGNLYGTTSQGGAGAGGVVYKLDTSRHETVLYSFAAGPSGTPRSGVVRDASGNLSRKCLRFRLKRLAWA